MVGEPNPDNREAIETYGQTIVLGEMPPRGSSDAGDARPMGRGDIGPGPSPDRLFSMTGTRLVDRDRAAVWHPYTQMLTAPPPLPVVRAEGVYLYTDDGRRILDGISSWWVNILGHSHPRLERGRLPTRRHGSNTSCLPAARIRRRSNSRSGC